MTTSGPWRCNLAPGHSGECTCRATSTPFVGPALGPIDLARALARAGHEHARRVAELELALRRAEARASRYAAVAGMTHVTARHPVGVDSSALERGMVNPNAAPTLGQDALSPPSSPVDPSSASTQQEGA